MRRFLGHALALGSTAKALGNPPLAGSGTQAPLRVVPEAASPLDGDFEQFVVDLLDRWHVPGVAVGVVDGDYTWTNGYGLADVASDIPVTAHTLFFGCSTTKAFTGAAVASLVHSGEYMNPSFPQSAVGWKTPIADILPEEFVLQDEWATAHITLEDALTHRSGLPRHDAAYGGHNYTTRDMIRTIRYLPASEPPRTKFQYCNIMYLVASAAVEALTSRWLGDVLKDWVWKPLGMDETYFDIQDAYAAGEQVATGYYWHPEEQAFKAVPYMAFKGVTGAGAILSSVTDYSKWIRSLISEDKPLPKAVHDDIKTPRIFDSTGPSNYDGPSGYALGWSTTTYKGHRIWSHDGGADAWGAEVTFLPDLGFGVVTFANTGQTSNAIGEIITYKLIDDKIGLPEEKRADWEDDWQKRMDAALNKHKGAKEVLFPDVPETPLPPLLPLEAYAGTYFHPAFRNTTISVGGPEPARRPDAKLGMYREDAVWPSTAELEHVSGEFWIAYSHVTSIPVAPFDILPIEFKTGVDGKVMALTIEFGYNPSGKGEGVFTFEKLAL